MDVVVCSSFSRFSEHGDVDGFVGAERGIILCHYDLTEACVEVCEFVYDVVVVVMGDSYKRPGSEAAYWGVCRGERDVREYVPVYHSACPGVCLVVVGYAGVGFNLSNVG